LPYEYEWCVIGLWNDKGGICYCRERGKKNKNSSTVFSQRCLCTEDGLLTNATVADDAIRFVAAGPNNNEPAIRTKATADYEPDIEKENVNENIQPINLVNEPFQQQDRK